MSLDNAVWRMKSNPTHYNLAGKVLIYSALYLRAAWRICWWIPVQVCAVVICLCYLIGWWNWRDTVDIWQELH